MILSLTPQPENVLLAGDTSRGLVAKICDFSNASELSRTGSLNQRCGTWGYCPPQAYGVVLYLHDTDSTAPGYTEK